MMSKILSKMFVPGTKQENISTAGKYHLATSAVGSYQKLFPRCPDLQLWEGFGKTPLPSSEDRLQGAQRHSGPPLVLPTPLYSPGQTYNRHAPSTPAGHRVQQWQCRLLWRTDGKATLNDFWQCWHTSLHILKYLKHKQKTLTLNSSIL